MKNIDAKQTIADNIRALMEANPKVSSQSKLAKKSGVGQRTIGRILNMEVSASTDSLDPLARALGVETHTLFVVDGGVEKLIETPKNAQEFVSLYRDKLESLTDTQRMELIAEIANIKDEIISKRK